MAKSAFAVEFPGESTPPNPNSTNKYDTDRVAVFKGYFPGGFDGVADACPSSPTSDPYRKYTSLGYQNVYDIYADTKCPNNASNTADITGTFEIPVSPYERNGYHDLGRRR